MTMTDELYALAAGYDVVIGSLVKLTTIIPSSDVAFAGPAGIAHYDPGLVKIQGDGEVRLVGFAKVTWLEGILTFPQYTYLSANYCNNGLSGPVTIYTTLGGVSYVRMNAIMTLRKPAEMQAQFWYKGASIDFTRLRPAA